MLRHFISAALMLVVSVVHFGNGSRILGVFPTPSVSHQVVFRALTLALNKKGHELVVVTTDPVNDPSLKNYTEIDISFLYDQRPDMNIITIREWSINLVDFFTEFEPMMTKQTDDVLSLPEFKKLYELNSNKKFDLLLVEMFMSPAYLALAKQFDIPVIGMTSLGLPSQIQYSLGLPITTSHPARWESGMRDPGPFTFSQRLKNFIAVWKYIYYHRTLFTPKQQAVAEKHFGKNIGDIAEMERNVSVIFVNEQEPLSFVQPKLPGVIGIGGTHVSKKVEHLPKDLQKILDQASQGFIYMSLGSNVKSNMLSIKTRGEFIAAFAKLPYKVIWKFEDDEFPGKPDNVLLMKWAPQKAILAHPNVKAFIYQGGLQSTEEAVSQAVPLIGLPVMGDQDMQVNKMVSLGVAKKLEITALNRDDLLEAIRAVTLDKSYKERMLNLRSIINDKPNDQLENAIWWTEHVIRHRGASYLRSTTGDEPWYSRQDMDVIAFISAGSVVLLSLTLVILYKLVKKICGHTAKSHGVTKKLD